MPAGLHPDLHAYLQALLPIALQPSSAHHLQQTSNSLGLDGHQTDALLSRQDAVVKRGPHGYQCDTLSARKQQMSSVERSG